VFVVTSKFFVHWRRAHREGDDHTLSTKNHQQMAQRSTQRAAIALNRSGALTARQVLVEELGNSALVDASNVQTSAVDPLAEMGDAAHAVGERGRCVPSVGQVLLERINVRRERPSAKPVDPAERWLDVAQGGLLKWDHHWTRPPKLCLEDR